MVPSISDRICISYYGSRQTKRMRLYDKLYLRVGDMVVSTLKPQRVSLLTTLRNMLTAIAVYPEYISKKKRSRLHYIQTTWEKWFFKKSKEEIYQLPAKEIVLRSVPIGNTITSVNLWRSLKAFYFPRCKEYTLRSESQRLRSYTITDEAKRIYESESLTYIADSILSDICRMNEDYELFGKYLTERFR